MNKNTKRLFTLLIIALSFASCKKEEAIVATTTETAATQELVYPSIKNGRLNFPTMDAFRNYMEAIKKIPIEEVEKMNIEHGFKSHYASGKGAANVIESVVTSSYSSDSYIADDYFGAVLNEEHQMQVDYIIAEANNTYSYMVPEGEEYKILAFETALANGTVLPEDIPTDGNFYNSSLYVYPTNANLQISECFLDGKNDNKLQTRGALTTRIIQWSTFDGRWRLHAEAWRVNWGIYASVGIESKCNRVANFFSLWSYYVNSNAQKLSVGFQGNMKVEANFTPNGGITSTVPVAVNILPDIVSVTDDSRAFKLFDQATAVLGIKIGGSNNGASSPIINSSGAVVGATGNNANGFSIGTFKPAKLIVREINLTTKHTGTKDNVLRSINMNFSL
jgi:hypothetical protein